MRMRRVPSISSFFALLVSPDGPVIVTTGMVLLLRSFRFEVLRGTVPASRIADFDLDPLIVQDDDTGSESLRCGELHFHLFALLEENRAVAHEERVDPELDLVEQISLQKRLPETTVTIDDEVLSILLLEFRRPRRDIAADDGGVAPFRFLQGVREDMLSDLVDPPAVRPCLMRKGLREEFVRMPPHQHRVARGEQVKCVLFRLVIEVLRGPGVRVPEDP